MKRCWLVALAGLALPGCYLHREYDRNAPGLTDLDTPPKLRLEVPDDPGRHGVLLSGGILGGGGVEARADGSHGAGQLQLELSAAYFGFPAGQEETPERLPPLTGLNLGYTLVGTDLARHALYLEAQRSSDLLGAAVGWTWNPANHAIGPQATLFYGPIYARLGWRLGEGPEAIFGLALKGYAKLSWFR